MNLFLILRERLMINLETYIWKEEKNEINLEILDNYSPSPFKWNFKKTSEYKDCLELCAETKQNSKIGTNTMKVTTEASDSRERGLRESPKEKIYDVLNKKLCESMDSFVTCEDDNDIESDIAKSDINSRNQAEIPDDKDIDLTMKKMSKITAIITGCGEFGNILM